ncbi:helix-turn-helix transcriptional regulator [Lentisalinibacter salinarum]|uniref:helix-turn-helix transcriptional regulator n=1 Tax=Lentisalinibacter salinarum TaxID=2992239 RepID=UPI00386333AD
MSIRILRLPEVIVRTGLSRSTIYKRMTEDRFPLAIDLDGRAVGWLEDEIEEYLAGRVRLSRNEDET